jgi:tRNA modification GTPase
MLLAKLEGGARFMDDLLRTANEGQILRRGVRVAIVGRPNVGKSSLLNLLLGRDRAIVSPVAGTTRDTIEETADIRGVPVVFVDTAGLRDADDLVEQEGVRRSQRALQQAELVLHVVDASEPSTPEDARHLAEFAARKRIIARNKCDLPARLALPDELTDLAVDVSCVTAAGLETLKDAIVRAVWGGDIRAEMLEVMINSRHQDALRRAREAAERGIAALRQAVPLDLVAVDLRICVNAVGEVVGQTATDDLLDTIFSQFCLGK